MALGLNITFDQAFVVRLDNNRTKCVGQCIAINHDTVWKITNPSNRFDSGPPCYEKQIRPKAIAEMSSFFALVFIRLLLIEDECQLGSEWQSKTNSNLPDSSEAEQVWLLNPIQHASLSLAYFSLSDPAGVVESPEANVHIVGTNLWKTLDAESAMSALWMVQPLKEAC